MYAQQGPPQPAFIPQVQQATMQPQYTGGQPQYINQGVPHQTSGYVGDMKQEGPPAQQQIFVNGARSAPQQPPMQPIGAPQQYYSASPLAVLGQGSAPVDCPACRHRNMTITNAEIGNTNHAWAAGFCFFLGLGCIPYLMTSFKDVRHNCGHCGALLATWHRSGRTVVHAHS